MNTHVLVTGGAGFVGSNLVRKLVGQGYKVSVLDNLSRGRVEYIEDLNDVEIFAADITDKKSCDAAFKSVDKVVHLAAFGSVVESVEDPYTNFNMNVLGTFNVLNLCVENSIEKLVFSSTGGALIGDVSPPVDERSLPKPISPYGASKLCCEAYCHAFSKSFDLNTVCLRFANVYGPNSYHKTGVINRFFNAIKDEQPFILYGDGTSSRDYIHVGDLTDGIALASENDKVVDDVIHIAGGREVSLNELAETIKMVACKPMHPIEYRDKRKGEVDRNFADYTYAKSVLGFEPKYNLKKGLQELWDTYDWTI